MSRVSHLFPPVLTQQITKDAQPVTSFSSAFHDCDIENCPSKPTGPARLLDRQIRRNRYKRKGLPPILHGVGQTAAVSVCRSRSALDGAFRPWPRIRLATPKTRRASPGNSYNRYRRRLLIQLKQQEGFAQIRTGATSKVYPFALYSLFCLPGEIPFSVNDEVSHPQGTHLDQLSLQCLAVRWTAGNLLTR